MKVKQEHSPWYHYVVVPHKSCFDASGLPIESGGIYLDGSRITYPLPDAKPVRRWIQGNIIFVTEEKEL